MEDPRRQRLGRILERAQELPAPSTPAAREELIRAECPDDPELAAEARSLLDAIDRAGGFLRQPTVRNGAGNAATSDSGQSAAMREGPGATIGRYKLLQQIGEGGFGAVFMAEQREPVHRRVALKIIKLGMDTRQVVARFEAERQALAIMDHPNIAKVHDAGATETGRPYFVMELVKGDPITAYCDSGNLTIDQRLALFVQVCLAVQHAHQKGVIHRDLKPSNVLVSTQDGRPHVKVIDFGIAKATHSRLTEKTLFTEHRQLIGTPAYMSPEQADGSLDIDTRTDVYSLGVLLYELLTGTTPFDDKALRSAAFGEIQRIIREEEPPKPSTRLSQSTQTLPGIAARRHVEPRRLGTLVRGDLDWIVMKALEKDRARRYDTAAGLATDIERHLQGDPVVAAPPGAAYRARKFVRRHRFGVAAGAAIFAALLFGLVATGYGLYRAVNAERLAVDRFEQAETARAEAVAAQSQAEKARAEAVVAKDTAEKFNRIASAVTEFFTKDLLDLHAVPEGGKEITVRELLDAVPTKIDQYFKSDPAVEGIIRERVGQLYRRIGELQRSTSYLQEAIPLLEKGLGPDSKQTLSAVHRLGELNMDLQRYAQAADLFHKAYKGRLAAYGMEYAMTGSSLTRRGSARVAAGRIDEGLADLREIQKYTEAKEGRDGRNFVLAGLELGAAFNQVKRFEESVALSRENLDTVLRKGGNLAVMEWAIRYNLAGALHGLARHDEALQEADKTLAFLARIYPPDHQTFVEVRLCKGGILAALGRLPEAAAELDATYNLAVSIYGPASPIAHQAAQARADVADKAGDSAGAQTWRELAK